MDQAAEGSVEEDLLTELYFGSLKVNFAKVAGNAVGVQEGDLTLVEGEKKEKTVSGIEVPFLPAHSYVPRVDSETTKLPSLLSSPLLKTEWVTNITGTKSGIRSAVVHFGNDHYRLKGCGNQDKQGVQNGFIVQEIPDGNGKLEIRGSCFEDLCYREVFMTNLIGSKMVEAGLQNANQSLGYFKYDAESWGDPHPEIPKFCGVFRTVGDKRAGDHLLGGLEQLLPQLIPESFESAKIKKLFDSDRLDEDGITATWMACATCGAQPLDLVPHSYPECDPSQPDALPKKWTPLWTKCQETLKKHYLSSQPPILPYLYWRIGWDCGLALRVMHTAKVSWGTYQDSLGLHSNGHANNMVVLPPSQITKHFLYPLDYDMAYTLDSFFGPDPDGNLIMEGNSMRMSLSGGDLNSGVQGASGSDDPRVSILTTALRDTLLAAFEIAFAGKEDPHPFREDMREPSIAMMQLSLMLTLNVRH